MPTTEEMINNRSQKVNRYRRLNETEAVLESIHGSAEAAKIGAWDFVRTRISEIEIERLLTSHKRGKFLRDLVGRILSPKEAAEENKQKYMNKAIATKYSSFLSRRQFNFISKVHNSVYDPETQVWSSHVTKIGEYKLEIPSTFKISDYSVLKFLDSVDMGEIHSITGYCGSTRTVTGLIHMIIDLTLCVPGLYESLIWFNGITDHFIFQFSDDGAPESDKKTMSIGSITPWNFGERCRSRTYHYVLHCINAGESEPVCRKIWLQHTEEMKLIQSMVFNVNGRKITVEFQPSADQKWQAFAAGEIGLAATYFSNYASVHKSDVSFINGSIGHGESDKWKPPTVSSRNEHLQILNKFRATLPVNLSDKVRHNKELNFMADNGLRQFEEPPIGQFAEDLRPESLHLEINSQAHVLDLTYKESVRRELFEKFFDILLAPVNENRCGLNKLACLIHDQYNNVSTRALKLKVRLIGEQAIQLARYGYRLADCLFISSEYNANFIKYIVICKIVQTLRDIGSMLCKVDVDPSYPKLIKRFCTLYFNLFSLYFKSNCNSTVWNMGYAVPYHVQLFYDNFKHGYGLTSMQGKESKHSEIKKCLKLQTNRSCNNETGKWVQCLRASWVNQFWMPIHFPRQDYYSHSTHRNPELSSGEDHCVCSRLLQDHSNLCNMCHTAKNLVEHALNGSLPPGMYDILFPKKCQTCQKQFADVVALEKHNFAEHKKAFETKASQIIPSECSVPKLKEYLQQRDLRTDGKKPELVTRLEGALGHEI